MTDRPDPAAMTLAEAIDALAAQGFWEIDAYLCTQGGTWLYAHDLASSTQRTIRGCCDDPTLPVSEGLRLALVEALTDPRKGDPGDDERD